MRRKVQDSIIILWCNNYHSQRAIFTYTPTKSCLNIGGLNDWAGLAPQLLGGSSLKAYRRTSVPRSHLHIHPLVQFLNTPLMVTPKMKPPKMKPLAICFATSLGMPHLNPCLYPLPRWSCIVERSFDPVYDLF